MHKMNRTITHLTSVHPRYDTRVFLRECCSLAKVEEYSVSLIVADNLGDELKNDVSIYDVGKLDGRLNRVLKTTKKVFQKAKELDSDIYHFHDPELIPIGLKLKRMGKEVIFDVHEDTSSQIKNKFYIPKPFRAMFGFMYSILNGYIAKKFRLVLAEASYEAIYKDKTQDYIILQNFPDTKFLEPYRVVERRKNGIFYIGGVSNERGLDVTIKALKILKDRDIDFYMHYIGPIYSQNLIADLDLEGIEDKIKFYGNMVLNEGFEISKECKVGLSVLKPVKNMQTSYSTKVFEYMAVNLPVITSNFPLYQDVVETFHTGRCIDPQDGSELADAIEYIFTHEEEAKVMGENGSRAVAEQFNWDIENRKLLALYEEILK